jgi:hypothetical protein
LGAVSSLVSEKKIFEISANQSILLADKKKFKIILLILDFKLGTVDNQKDYLQTWENSF